jgi:hypothetical protein
LNRSRGVAQFGSGNRPWASRSNGGAPSGRQLPFDSPCFSLAGADARQRVTAADSASTARAAVFSSMKSTPGCFERVNCRVVGETAGSGDHPKSSYYHRHGAAARFCDEPHCAQSALPDLGCRRRRTGRNDRGWRRIADDAAARSPVRRPAAVVDRTTATGFAWAKTSPGWRGCASIQ